MNLGDSAPHDQARDLEQLIIGNLPIGDDRRRFVRQRETGVRIRIRFGQPAERVDDVVVLPHEEVVIEAQPDRPIIRKGDGLLARPFRIDRVALIGSRARRARRPERGQIAVPLAFSGVPGDRLHQQLRPVGRIALCPRLRPLVKSVYLRCVPPGGDVVAGRLVGSGRPLDALLLERRRGAVLGDQRGLHPVVRAAAESGDLVRRQRGFNVVFPLRGTAEVGHDP